MEKDGTAAVTPNGFEFNTSIGQVTGMETASIVILSSTTTVTPMVYIQRLPMAQERLWTWLGFKPNFHPPLMP